MKPPLELEGPSLGHRILFAGVALVTMGLASLFAVFPLIHFGRFLMAGGLSWALLISVGIFVPLGVLMFWIGSRFRIWVLPYRFTVNFSEMVCGYSWRGRWVDRIDLDGVEALVVAPGWSQRVWPWVILARFGSTDERKAILNSHRSFRSERESLRHCLETCSRMATYLEVPVELDDEWSVELQNENLTHLPRP